jgi:hypothetical protein
MPQYLRVDWLGKYMGPKQVIAIVIGADRIGGKSDTHDKGCT